MPGDKPRFVTREKQRRVGNVLHRAEPPLRNRGRHPRDVVRPERFHTLRENVSWQHGVHRDIVRRKFNGRGANEAQLSCLAGRIVAPAWIPGNRSGDRRRNDNAPLAARFQSWQACVDREKGAFEIDVEHLIPVGHAHLTELGGRKDSSVRTDHVDTAMPLGGRRRHSGAIFRTRNIRRYSAGHSSWPNRSTDLGSGSLALCQIARRKQNLGAFPGEDARNSLPDPFARPGDDNGTACDRCQHDQTILAGTSNRYYYLKPLLLPQAVTIKDELVNAYRTNLKQKYPDCWQWISLARRISGHLTEDEANVLFQLARARTPLIDPVIVELGAGRGATSLLLAAGLRGKNTPRLFSIQRDGDADPQALHRNLRRSGLGQIVDATAAHARNASANWKDCIDILFINATEDYDPFESDLLLWSGFVKLGGIVVLHGVTGELPEHLQSESYGNFRHIDSLAWAVKQCDASIATPAPSIAAEADSKARQQQIERLFHDLGRVRHLLHRSIEAMHLNSIPLGLEAQLLYHDAHGDHLEDATEIARVWLQEYVRRTGKELAESKHAIRALRRSWSWRLTAPLRLGVEVLYAFAGLLRGFAHGSPKAQIVGLAHWILFRRQVRASGLLDERYYRAHCPDVNWARTSPLLHFFVCGAREGKNPNELFDIDYYLRCYPDVAHSGQNPLIHYLKDGAYEGRDPHPYFDSSFYLEENHDVREDRLNPLAHYLAPGIAEGRDPNPWFDTSEYLEQNPDVAMFGLNPLTHHLCSR